VKFSGQGAEAGCGLVEQVEFDVLPLDLRASFECIVTAVRPSGSTGCLSPKLRLRVSTKKT
jgi:hypothetical protein